MSLKFRILVSLLVLSVVIIGTAFYFKSMITPSSTTTTPSPTPYQNTFIDLNSIKIPDNVAGFTVSKVSSSSSVLAKDSLLISSKPAELAGDELIAVNKQGNEALFGLAKSYVKNYADSELGKMGYKQSITEKGKTFSTPSLDKADEARWGYLKIINGKIQVASFDVVDNEKMGTIEIRIFLSKIENISNLP